MTERQTQIMLRDTERALAYRTCPVTISRADTDADLPDGARDFRVAISTDKPLKRGSITEVIVHDSLDNFDLSRLEAGAMNVLNGHASFFGGGGDPFGTFQPGTARVEDGELIVTCRLVDDGQMGTAMIARWDAGICTTFSIGYEWLRYEKVTDDDGVDTGVRRVVKTKIYECSLVGVPADENAQLRDAFAQMLNRSTPTEDTDMPEAQPQPTGDTPPTGRAERDANPQPSPTPPAADPTVVVQPESESQRAFNAAQQMRAAAPARAQQWTDQFLRDADTAARDQARADIEAAIRQTANSLATLPAAEHAQPMDKLSVRIGQILHAAQTPDAPPPARDTGETPTRTTAADGMRALLERQAEFERDECGSTPLNFGPALAAQGRAGSTAGEAARVLARHREFTDDILGRCESAVRGAIEPLLRNGIMVTPRDLLDYRLERQRRIDLALGRAQTAAAADNKGDSLIQTDVLVEHYVEGLYASSKLYEAGCTMRTGLTSLELVPVQSSNLSAAFYTETGQIPNTDFGIGEVTLSPHRVGVANPATLMLQILTGGAIARIQMYNILSAMDLGIEGAYLNGTGAGNNPRGLRNQQGIDVVAVGTNGGNITVAKLQEPATELKKDEIFPDGKFTALLTPDTLAYGQSRARFGTGGDNFIIPENLMNARYRILESTLLPTNLAKGTGANLHAAAFGRFSDFWCASFGMPVVTHDDLTLIDRGQTRVVVNAFVDCVLTRKESIKLMNDISVA